MAKNHRYLQLSRARNVGPVPRIPVEWIEGRPMRLNKYLAHAGLADRRSCEHLIKAGQVSVNGETVKNPGELVSPTDEIKRWNKALNGRPGLAYALVNRAAGIEETALGKLLRHPELATVKWQSVFPRPAWMPGLSLLTNDERLIEQLRARADQAKALLMLPDQKEGVELPVSSLLEPDAHLPAGEVVGKPKADVVALLSFDKRDLPRGFYRFLRAEEIGRLRGLG